MKITFLLLYIFTASEYSLGLLSPCNENKPCKNNGHCVLNERVGAPNYCECASNFVGPRCEYQNPCYTTTARSTTRKPVCANGARCNLALSVDKGASFTCECPIGFAGLLCDKPTHDNACYPPQNLAGPCLNGAACKIIGPTPGHYACRCPDGFKGERCEVVDHCQARPCQNGALCVVSNDTYVCRCSDGFTGKTCTEDVDECSVGNGSGPPCLNQGTCLNIIGSFKCICPADFTGDRCENRFYPCNPPPCLNKGICVITGEHSHKCQCQAGFTGINCEINIDECALGHKCSNGSTCLDRVNSYTCQCPPQLKGTYCEEDVDECTLMGPQLCRNGATCLNHHGGHSCVCVNGWTGPDCSENIDDCYITTSGRASPVCMNGATCHDRVGSYYCQCPPGKTGLICHLDDACSTNPCRGGSLCTTNFINGDYVCSCPPGFTGNECTQDIDECLLGSPCEHGGSCVNVPGTFECACLPGFSGPRCETNINECATEPCLNDGTCLDETGKYTCVCMPGYTGERCEVEIDECASHPCHNGATCTDLVDGFTCTCPMGFTGVRCDFNIDDCAYDSDPPGPKCLNGGTCQDRVGHYVCSCAPGYDGLNCESNVNQCLQNSRLCGARGSCLNEPDLETGKGYRCKCEPGWAGPRCNLKLDPCNYGDPPASTRGYYEKLYGQSSNAMIAGSVGTGKTPCQNGGICHIVYNNEFKYSRARAYNSYESQHVPANRLERSSEISNTTGGGIGSSSEQSVRAKRSPVFSRQSSSPSSRSLSIDYECECLPGTYGDRCEYNYDDCLTNPCRNGATCRDMLNGYECTCAAGFEGRNCEVDVDECDPNPCLNNGKCSDRVNGYTCKCKRGFYGTNCGSDYDECRTNPCLNGGACIKSDSGYKCQCGSGYTGVRCQSKVDPCHHNPCQHGGFCVKRYPQNMRTNRGMSYSTAHSDYVCRCLPGYRGRDCEQNINECLAITPSPCANGGTCIDLVDAYKCVCRDGWTGQHCTLPQDPCRLQHGTSPCLNGGSCYPNNNNLAGNGASVSYICKCPTGFTGQLCAEDVDECYESDHSNRDSAQKGPCRNGASCVNTFGSYECKCEPGFGGSNCEHEIDECLLAALTESGYNPSVYFDRVADSKRTGPGWNSENPCHNGATCVDGLNSFTCICPPGFTGPRCRTEINECAPNGSLAAIASPCLNGGSCTDYVDSFVCTCPLGFSGSRCEINDPDCTPSSCLNGATCLDGVHGYTCQCRPGFEGRHCQIREDPCSSGDDKTGNIHGTGGPCLNGGTCVSLAFASAFSPGTLAPSSPKFACHCPRDFAGMLCEKRVDPCTSHPPVCQNGATCYNGPPPSPLSYNGEGGVGDSEGPAQFQPAASFHCQCTAGWTGQLCDVRMASCEAMQSSSPVQSVCDNGGTCLDVHYPGPPALTFHKCACPGGFEGSRCQSRVDHCQTLNPCQNGATCSNVKGETEPYVCDCLPGFEGVNCEINKDDCRGNPCKHGGICHDLVNNFSCSCPAGTMGFMCEINVNECLDVVCHHGGTCVDKIGAAECICPPGFVGQRCEGDVNECLSNPCHSMGSKDCIQLNNDYKCVCRPGYRGRHCEQKYDQCALQNPCQHSGFCRNSVNGGFECVCKPGYWGSVCQNELLTCRTSPCQAEEWCLDSEKGRRCYCDPERTYEIREAPSSHKMYSLNSNSGGNNHRCLAYRNTLQKTKSRANLEDAITPKAPGSMENPMIKQTERAKVRELEECLASGCPNPDSELGNGVCDRNCNTKACDWDGRDCSLGLNPWAKCRPANGTPPCWDRYGDGFCDPECDSLACLFDGFDCRQTQKPRTDNNYPPACPPYCSSAFASDLCDPSCTRAEGKNNNPNPSPAEGSLILVLNLPPDKIVSPRHKSSDMNNSTLPDPTGDGTSVLQALSLFLGTPLRFKKDRWGNPMVFPTPSGQGLDGQYSAGMGSSKIYLELDRSQCVAERDGPSNGDCFSEVGDAARFIAAAAVQGKLPPQLLRLESVQGLGENGEDDGDPLGGSGSDGSGKGGGGNTFRGTANQLTHIFAGGTAFLIISLLVGVLYSTQKRKRISRGITWFPEGFSLTTPPLAKKAKRSGKNGGPKAPCKRGKMCDYQEEDGAGLHGDTSSCYNDDNIDMSSGQWVLKPKGTGGACSEYSDNNSDNGTTTGPPVHYSPAPEEIMMRRREMAARINGNDGRNRPDGQEMRYADGNTRAYDYGQQQPRYTTNPNANNNNDYPIFLTVDRARGAAAPYYPDPRHYNGSYYLTTAGETDPLYPQPPVDTLKRDGQGHYNTLNPIMGHQNDYHPCLWPGQPMARVRQDGRQWTAQHYAAAASQGCRIGNPEAGLKSRKGQEPQDPLATSILTPPFTTQDEECMQQLKKSENYGEGRQGCGELGNGQAKEDVNVEGPAGITPIMISTTTDQCFTSSDGTGAKDQQGLNTTQYLILKGAKIDARTDDTHENPLHLAARFSRADSARFLLEAGADVNAQDYTGRTPLHTAIASDARGVFHLLLRSKFVKIDAPSQDGTTPLILSARLCSDVEMAKQLVETGADINAADDNGRTALHWAAAVNNYKIVRMLLEKGANPDAQDSKDETSIFLAAREGSYESAKILLIDFKANPDIANNVDILPIDVARDRLHTDIFELIAHKRERKLLYAATSTHVPANKKPLLNSPSKPNKHSVGPCKAECPPPNTGVEIDNNNKTGGNYRQPPLGYGQQVSVEPKLYPIVEIEDSGCRPVIQYSHSDQMTPPQHQEFAAATTQSATHNTKTNAKDANLGLAKIEVANHHERCSSLLTPEKSPHYQHPHYQQLHQAQQYQAHFSVNKQFEAVPAQFYQSTPYNRQQCLAPIPPKPAQQYYGNQGANNTGLLPFVSCYNNYSNSSSSLASSNKQHSSASSEQQSKPFLPPPFRNTAKGPSLDSMNPFDSLSTLTLTPPSVQGQDVHDELNTLQSLQTSNTACPNKGQDSYGVAGDYYGHDKLHMVSYPTPSPESSLDKWSYYSGSPPCNDQQAQAATTLVAGGYQGAAAPNGSSEYDMGAQQMYRSNTHTLQYEAILQQAHDNGHYYAPSTEYNNDLSALNDLLLNVQPDQNYGALGFNEQPISLNIQGSQNATLPHQNANLNNNNKTAIII